MIDKRVFLALLSVFYSLSLFSFDYSKLEPLYYDDYFKTLMHYRDGESEIDDPSFFLSKYGKWNLKAELNATVTKLLENNNSIDCRFPARILWIKEKLPSLKKLITSHKCVELDKILKDYQPISASLIFPTAHINSPASMYGHTFLRIDSNKQKSPLVSQAINYAAKTDETNGFLYAYEGLFGGYEGRYSILPYYKKIKEYNDMERRDIWEYNLNLNPHEIKKLLYHEYELRFVYSDYFFFTQNCSYNLLWLLQSAREDVDLVDNFNYKAIPIDTIRVIMKNGFIKNSTFRASRSKKIKTIAKKIENFNIYKSFVLNDYDERFIKNQSFLQQAFIVDLASEMLRLKRAKAKIENKKYIKSLMKILKTRSKIPIKSVDYNVKKPINPIKGHKTNRVAISKDKDYIYLAFKPAYHDLYDVDYGFKEGAYINFFDFALRLKDRTSVKLDRFNFVSISSFAIRDKLFKPLSWEVSFGFNRDYQDRVRFMLQTGTGLSYKNMGIFYYIFLDTTYYQSHSSDLSISPKLGFVKNFSYLKIAGSLYREFLTTGDKYTHGEIFSTYQMSNDFSLNLKYDITTKKKRLTASVFYYF